MDGTAPWAVLGLEPGASREQLKSAFRCRSRELHPDRGGDERAFAALVDAYRVLLPIVEAPVVAAGSPYPSWETATASRFDRCDVPRRPAGRPAGANRPVGRSRSGSPDSDRGAAFGRLLERALAA